MALSLRSARSIPRRFRPGSVTDRIRISLRSARGKYGPQGILLMVRKAVAGSKFWTTACSTCCTALLTWFSKSGA
ncbi:hypothetical protein HanPI659440_Chr10g0366261 [Helianthus annuus]|nr:hypothetical protein HanPI659440_Chr10g0366261 [Helianthus annuus]